jgi:hypothetical protein
MTKKQKLELTSVGKEARAATRAEAMLDQIQDSLKIEPALMPVFTSRLEAI